MSGWYLLQNDGKKKPGTPSGEGPGSSRDPTGSGFGLVFQHLPATVKTVGADVVTQMRFAGGGLYSDTWHRQTIVGAVHAALGRRFLVLLDGHDESWNSG
jgi:hypothetical protein